jgi:hypothetical protein
MGEEPERPLRGFKKTNMMRFNFVKFFYHIRIQYSLDPDLDSVNLDPKLSPEVGDRDDIPFLVESKK